MNPETKITYRLYAPKDKAQFIRCLEEVQDYFIEQDEVGWMSRSEAYGKWFAAFLLKEVHKNHGRIILAMDVKRVVGFIIGKVETIKPYERYYIRRGEKLGWIYLVYVDKRYRGRQIGQTLLQMMEAHFNKHKCTVVRLEAQGNLPKLVELYQRAGFKPLLMNMAKRLRQPAKTIKRRN